MCLEFCKRLDPNLPYYYYTSSHGFVEGEMPPFHEKPAKPRRPKRVPRREQPASQIGRRITLVEIGSGSIRAQFHNTPVSLPPLPNSSASVNIITEHNYAISGP